LLLEAALIKKYKPKYNIRLVDGKSYPLIRVVSKAEFPAIVTARKMDDKKSLYFGPYPSSTSVRLVLKSLRKIFPYQSILNHPKRICLYHHLGLCPCPPLFKTNEEKKNYKKTIRHIIGFLEGKSKEEIKKLEEERNNLSKNEEYEKASLVQSQLDAIYYVTQPKHQAFDYQVNPNLREDLRQKEMQDLQKILLENNISINLPKRIECYDNSNIQGTNPVSSMVVLTDGEIDKSQYRKFKIRSVKGPNDFATMQEVLTRRFKHNEWPMPDLLVVDGGKGQVSSAKEALQILNMKQQMPKFTIIGLAKREEIIITSDLHEIKLSRKNPALQLIMRIRDEAHRFAITYHRKLRSKAVVA